MKYTKKNAVKRIGNAVKKGLVDTVKDPTTYILVGVKLTKDIVSKKSKEEMAKDAAVTVLTSASIQVSTYVGVEVVNALNTKVEDINDEIK